MFVGIDKKRRQRYRSRQVQLVTILLLMVLLTFGCGKNDQKPQEPAAEAASLISLELAESGDGASVEEDTTQQDQSASSPQTSAAAGDSLASQEASTATTDSNSTITGQTSAQVDKSTAQVDKSSAQADKSSATSGSTSDKNRQSNNTPSIAEDGTYTSKDDVALYIHTYGKLPCNFITKKKAKKLGWSGGSLEEYAPGKSIGGDYFGNYEGLLPTDKDYRECDIDTLGKAKRGAKRIIYSDDGYIYYTGDHYETFELLYEP